MKLFHHPTTLYVKVNILFIVSYTAKANHLSCIVVLLFSASCVLCHQMRQDPIQRTTRVYDDIVIIVEEEEKLVTLYSPVGKAESCTMYHMYYK